MVRRTQWTSCVAVLEAAGAGKSALALRLRGWQKQRGNLKRPGRSYAVEKSLVVEPRKRPYRKPTLVGTPEREKVIEITLVKELGNLTP